MFFFGLGLLGMFWAAFSSDDFLLRIIVGACSAIVMGLSIKAYKLGETPKLEEEY